MITRVREVSMKCRLNVFSFVYSNQLTPEAANILVGTRNDGGCILCRTPLLRGNAAPS